MVHKYIRQAAFTLLVFTSFVYSLDAQNQPPEFVREAVGDVMRMLDSKDDSAINTFIEQSMVVREDHDRDSLIKGMKSIRKEMHGLRDDIAVEAEQDGVRMIMSDGKVEKHLKIVLDFEAEAISELVMIESPESMDITADNLSETFDQLERDGLAGVIYVKINGEVIMTRAFGLANKELGLSNQMNTVFGTGSRPIDYTVAAIYLLDQKGLIKLEDHITKYFTDVPEDKESITILHLLTGQSGLPDFFHTEEDWDPDLAWIDRETAVDRLLSQELLLSAWPNLRNDLRLCIERGATISYV